MIGGTSIDAENPPVIVSVDGAVGTVTFNRPKKKNALDIEMRSAIANAIQKLSDDATILCILITGGDEVFAGGADLNMLVDKGAQEVANLDLAGYWEPLKNCPKPVISAVSGFALGAGCELIMMTDIVIADTTAKLGQTECNVGIMPGAGGTQRLVRAVGKPLASLMLMSGEILNAERAMHAGLVSQVVEEGMAIERAKKIAKRISKMPPLALRSIKRTLAQASDLPLDSALALENREFLLLFDTDDKKEGMSAFLEKRRPNYSGK